MPISKEIRDAALGYVDAHLIDEVHIRNGFSFIHDKDLVDLIVLELRSARYVYRLMEMLDLRDIFAHPFCKFQIIQFAGVFEAAIDYLIFDRKYSNKDFSDRVSEHRKKIENYDTLTTSSGLSKNTNITVGGAEAYLCVINTKKKPRVNIKFDDRIKVCLDLGLLDKKLHDEITVFYKKRNSVHLSAKLKSAITVELSDTKRGFRRVNAFCEYVKRGLTRHGEQV